MPNNPHTLRFSLAYGQRVRVRPPHPDAGATGQVLNAYLYSNGTQIVFVGVPGGQGRYDVADLESLVELDTQSAHDFED